jgi:hypothetical protein
MGYVARPIAPARDRADQREYGLFRIWCHIGAAAPQERIVKRFYHMNRI